MTNEEQIIELLTEIRDSLKKPEPKVISQQTKKDYNVYVHLKRMRNDLS